MLEAPNNTWDVIDSRDVIERLEELQETLEELENAVEDADTDEDKDALLVARKELLEWRESDDAEELTVLEALDNEASDYAADWQHGEVLIRDTYFVEYAEELARDIGDITEDVRWPYTCIDWEAAAEELKQDYTSISFDGETYWIR